MCHLVTDASESVPQMAYKMLGEAANKRTGYLVVEAGIDSEDRVPLCLSVELVQLLHNNFLNKDCGQATCCALHLSSYPQHLLAALYGIRVHQLLRMWFGHYLMACRSYNKTCSRLPRISPYHVSHLPH
jgi:hypothetical protein